MREHAQSGHAGEVTRVASYEREGVFDGDGGLPHVVVANVLSGVLQRAGEARGNPRGVFADLKTRESSECLPGGCKAGGTLGELRPRDAADKKLPGRVARQEIQGIVPPSRTPAATEIDEKIGVEQHQSWSDRAGPPAPRGVGEFHGSPIDAAAEFAALRARQKLGPG